MQVSFVFQSIICLDEGTRAPLQRPCLSPSLCRLSFPSGHCFFSSFPPGGRLLAEKAGVIRRGPAVPLSPLPPPVPVHASRLEEPQFPAGACPRGSAHRLICPLFLLLLPAGPLLGLCSLIPVASFSPPNVFFPLFPGSRPENPVSRAARLPCLFPGPPRAPGVA